MSIKLKNAIKKNTFLHKIFQSFLNIVYRKSFKKLYIYLIIYKGKKLPKIPSPLEKVKIVKEYAKKFNIETFIETGTYKGAMVNAIKDEFKNIYSIELSKKLHEEANNKFSQYSHIKIIQGDSGKVLPKLLKNIKQPSLFWLDAHYSLGETARATLDCPILEEIRAILSHNIKNHIVLIDDAWGFGMFKDWPKLNDFKEFVISINNHLHYEIKNQVIIIY